MAGMNTILLIRKIFAAEDRVVSYLPGATLCPVCEYLGLPAGKIRIDRTVDTLRYCSCEQCDATFRADGLSAAALRLEKEQSIDYEPPVKQAKPKKKAKPVKRKGK